MMVGTFCDVSDRGVVAGTALRLSVWFVEGVVVCEVVHFGKHGRSKVREDRGVLQARVHAVVAV